MPLISRQSPTRRKGWPVVIEPSKYVRAGATGTGSGDDWTNAYTALPATLTRGTTYWIADGTYAAYTVDDAASGTTVITIRKATTGSYNHAAGWDSTYGDGSATFDGGFTITVPYVVLDGVTGGGPGAWTSGYGFVIDVSGAGDGNGLAIGDDADHGSVSHLEIIGHGDDGEEGSQDGINSGDGTDRTFSYCYVHDVGRTPLFNRAHNTIWEYLYTGRFESTSGQHAELASFWIDLSHTPVLNTTIRWSVFTHSEGTGGLIIEGTGIDIYGNVFYLPVGGEHSGGNGLIGSWSDGVWTNVKIYNNTFLNIAGSQTVTTVSSASFANVEFKNNLLWAGRYNTANVDTQSHNTMIGMVSVTGTLDATDENTSGDNPCPDYLSDEFTPSSNTTAGTTLAAPYGVDMHGRSRTTWTRGAVEYSE